MGQPYDADVAIGIRGLTDVADLLAQYGPAMEANAPMWVRLGMAVVLAPGQLLTGLWALFATKGWFDDFPGVGPALVAAEPPYNQHLAADTGAGFLAVGVALVAAAVWGKRSGVLVALVTFAAFDIPHLTYHVTHRALTLSTGAQVMSVALLAVPLVFAAVLAVGARDGGARLTPEPTMPTAQEATT
jgi:hypothetical protein